MDYLVTQTTLRSKEVTVELVNAGDMFWTEYCVCICLRYKVMLELRHASVMRFYMAALNLAQ